MCNNIENIFRCHKLYTRFKCYNISIRKYFHCNICDNDWFIYDDRELLRQQLPVFYKKMALEPKRQRHLIVFEAIDYAFLAFFALRRRSVK
mgnify:CR=1 FL=1